MSASSQPLRVLAVLPMVGHPRDSKRIAMLREAGFEAAAAAFERDLPAGRPPACPVELLGSLAAGRYGRRAIRLLSSLRRLRRAIRRSDLVYASGPDMAYAALLAGCGLGRPVVLEVGDIRGIQVAPGMKGSAVRRLEKYFADACSLLVATAPGFIEGYYRRMVGSTVPALVIENKLERSLTEELPGGKIPGPPPGRPLVDRPLRIGYFGFLRCEWSWRVLEHLARTRPRQIEIVTAGYGSPGVDLAARASRFPNLKFLGPYRSPEDLPALYGQVDLVWGCYPKPGPGDRNWRWARTNRFYESCFFRRPMVALAESGDSGDVAKYGIGPVVAGREAEATAAELLGITPGDLARWRESLSRVPPEVYLYTREAEDIKALLIKTVRDRMRAQDGPEGNDD